MKQLLLCTICLVAPLSALWAQAPAKQARTGQASAPSSQDLNIRAYIELLRSDVRKEKTQIMGEVMQLDAEQASKFWPVYKSFESELVVVGDKIQALIQKYAANYENLTASVADELALELLGVEMQRCDLKKKYYLRFKEALDPVTAARFLQVENQLERLIDLQIASELPVIGDR